MAVYGVDYVCDLYATYYFEADSIGEATTIARKLLDSDRFCEERMVPSFEAFPVELENICDNAAPFNADGAMPALTRDEIDSYIKED